MGTSANLQTLKQAIARNAAAVISLPSGGMLRYHKTRFLARDSGWRPRAMTAF
jgi:hypothetical protein